MNIKERDDESLLRQFRQGDIDAFEMLVSRYQQKIFGFIWQQIHHQEDALDLCQQTFINVYTKAHQFEGRSTFKVWLYRIAVNLCKNYFRDMNPTRENTIDIDTLELESVTNIETLSVKDEQQRLVLEALNQIPKRQRITVQLRILQQLSFNEISETLDCSVGAAKANYHHGVIALQKLLETKT